MTALDFDKEIRINPEYESLVVALSEEQYENLKQSIKKEGYWPKGYPIVVNSQGVILDGHNRFKVCRELQVDISRHIVIREFHDELLEQLFVTNANLKRRHLSTDAQKIEQGHKLKPIYQKLAKRNESLGGKGVSPECI